MTTATDAKTDTTTTEKTAAPAATAPETSTPPTPSQTEVPAGQETKASETPAGQPGEAGSTTPPTYDLTVPEGMALDKEMVEAVTPIFQELNLSPEQAQKLADVYSTHQQAQAQAQQQAIEAQAAEWQEAAKTDKEFGGPKFEEALTVGNQALKTFGSPELVTLLETTGLGNHPELIRMCYRVGKELVAEGRTVHGTPAGGQKTPLANRLFPSMKE